MCVRGRRAGAEVWGQLRDEKDETRCRGGELDVVLPSLLPFDSFPPLLHTFDLAATRACVKAV